MTVARGVWFGLGVVLFLGNIICGFIMASNGDPICFLSAAVVILVGISLDMQLEDINGEEES